MKQITALLVAFVMAFALTGVAGAQTKTTTKSKPVTASKAVKSHKSKKAPTRLKHAMKTAKVIKTRTRHGRSVAAAAKPMHHKMVIKPVKTTKGVKHAMAKRTITHKPSKQVKKQ